MTRSSRPASLRIVANRVVDRALKRARAKASGWEPLDDEEEEKIKKQDRADKDRLRELAKKYSNVIKGQGSDLRGDLKDILRKVPKLRAKRRDALVSQLVAAMHPFRITPVSERLDHYLALHKELSPAQKKEIRGATASISIPDSMPVRTY